ncbi:fasciclin domain-containing protein [Pontibacter fetidus]|uniref:Fasciclin domain-containing protein n=1 Tax=Pontibacter fetidus TaxID=2700082 RepID=A0A6B2GXY3_9BACT|nr:fasciclin domain-containing protein [Pontibacter fetidus]NDK54843.1 fasciclin domain-containing protein [Pontibacter fetidus]
MRPSNFILAFTLSVFLFTNINVQAQTVASVETTRSTMIEYIMKDRPVLVNLLTTAGLIPALSGDSPYTLFAPPEADLKALQNEPADKIRTIMAGHLVKGNYTEKDLKDGAKLEALNGETITICRKKSTLVNGVSISKPDIALKNGTVHIISSTISY